MVVPPTRIAVSFPEPQSHLLQLVVTTPDLDPGEHEFLMPVWTPGSYLIREYARLVESVEAFDGTGQRLAVEKCAKNRWRVALAAPGDVRFCYRVYARDLTVRTNHLDEERAYWNGAATYIVGADRVDAPFAITVDAPEGWKVHTGLAFSTEHDAWLAATFDEAVDAPFVVSDAPVGHFHVAGVPHEMVFDGVAPSQREPLQREVARLVQAAAALFGGKLPYDRYVFLVFADGSGSGGLEHANSTVIHIRRASLRKADERKRVLSLFSHEHFHVWNVKRVRPVGIATLDYERENYTRDLWLSEGFTSYYQELLSYRAGVYSRGELLDRLIKNWHEVTGVPGRAMHSVSDSSFDAWIKLYRPDETSRSTTVSYYSKGALVAWCLDLRIRAASHGQASLDDVMRGLYADFEEHGPGQSRELVLALINEAATCALDEEFRILVDGVEDPPLADWLAPFGLTIAPSAGRSIATLNVRTRVVEGRLCIASVDRGGAGDAIGLCPDDELVSIDRERVAPNEFAATLSEQYAPDQEVELHVFRRGRLTGLQGQLGSKQEGTPHLVEATAGLSFS